MQEDPVYFAKNYCKIISLDEGLVPFKLMISGGYGSPLHANRFNIAKLPRQTGKSTTLLHILCVMQYLMIMSILVY